jgi:NUDIX domain
MAIHNNYRPENIGKWGFPGGHVEVGEDLLSAIYRELQEEFGVVVSDIVYLESFHYVDTIQHAYGMNYNGPLEFEHDPNEILQKRWLNLSDVCELNDKKMLHIGREWHLAVSYHKLLHSRSSQQPALIIAHPGHELLYFGWLIQTKPSVAFLTDGSGSKLADQRSHQTIRNVLETSSSLGCWFGTYSERSIYQHILDRDLAFFTQLTDDLIAFLERNEPSMVVSDAYEGFSPVHDLVAVMTDVAIHVIRRTRTTHVERLVIRLDGQSQPAHAACIKTLTDEELERKIRAARRNVELRQEVERAIDLHGIDSFRVEILEYPTVHFGACVASYIPAYEQHAAHLLERGEITEVITRLRHVQPIVEHLMKHYATKIH